MFPLKEIKELEEFRAKNQRLQKVKSAKHPRRAVIFLNLSFSLLINVCVYLFAAVGRPVASLFVSPLPVDLSGRVLSLPTWTMAAENSHGPAFLHIPCAVSAHIVLQYPSQPSAKYRCVIFNLVHSTLDVSSYDFNTLFLVCTMFLRFIIFQLTIF